MGEHARPTDKYLDPIDIGMRIHPLIMSKIGISVKNEKELVEIGRMIDCLVGSAQVHAVEHGIGGQNQRYRDAILEKLKSLKLA